MNIHNIKQGKWLICLSIFILLIGLFANGFVSLLFPLIGILLGSFGFIKIGKEIQVPKWQMFIGIFFPILSMTTLFIPHIVLIMKANRLIKQHKIKQGDIEHTDRGATLKIHEANGLKTANNNRNKDIDINDLSAALPLVKHVFENEVIDFNIRLGDTSFKQQAQLSEADMQQQMPVMKVFKSYFGVYYVLDKGDHFTYIKNSNLKDANISVDELHSIAVQNLNQRLNRGEDVEFAGYEAFNMLLAGGDFESSLVLLEQLWDSILAIKYPNGYFVSVVAKDLVFVADATNQDAINQLYSQIENIESGGKVDMLSKHLFKREIGNWVPVKFSID